MKRNIGNKLVKGIISLLLCVVCLSNVLGCTQAYAARWNVNRKTKATIATDSTSMEIRGATIWPVEDLVMYSSDRKEIETITAGTPLMALAQNDNYFKIYYKGKAGYIASDSCMINLPDVMQEEMLYDITNAYSSIYKIHGYDIEGVTGEVLYPYAEIGDEEYLVPLLYPVALKLYEAEEEALSFGYTLKIYDAYRPYAVTKDIYAKTTAFVENNPIYVEYMTEAVNGVSYGQSNFLAKSVSNHNYGVAVDITIADLETGKELEMQSPMHELSTRSVLDLNNSEAELLSDIMLAHGFGDLKSEWWHFEIREYRKSYAAFQVKPYES